MKKLILSIFMLTGLSMSSQENNVTAIKPVIIASPAPINPDSGTEIITCNSGNGYYVGDGCACVNIYCSNGVTQTWCLCKDGKLFQAQFALLNDEPNGNSNNNPKKTKIEIDAYSSFISSDGTNSDPLNQIVNIQKTKNAILEISSELKIDDKDYTLIITPGKYEIKNNKLQTLCSKK